MAQSSIVLSTYDHIFTRPTALLQLKRKTKACADRASTNKLFFSSIIEGKHKIESILFIVVWRSEPQTNVAVLKTSVGVQCSHRSATYPWFMERTVNRMIISRNGTTKRCFCVCALALRLWWIRFRWFSRLMGPLYIWNVMWKHRNTCISMYRSNKNNILQWKWQEILNKLYFLLALRVMDD